MIKRTITAVTLLLVILGVGIVLAKASPRVNRLEAVSQRVYVAGRDARDFVSPARRLDLGETVNGRVTPDGQNVRVLDEGVQEYVGGEVPDLLVGAEVKALLVGVGANYLPAPLGVRYRGGNFYLTSRRNLGDVLQHLNHRSLLVADNPRGCFPDQLARVLSGLNRDDLQKVSVFKTVTVVNDLLVDETLAVPVPTSFEVASVKALRHTSVAGAVRPVPTDAVEVTESLKSGLAVA